MIHRNRLLISNVPRSCSVEFLQNWVEAQGYNVFRINLIRDVISGTSPSFAHVQLMNESKLDEAARALNGRIIDHRMVSAQKVAFLPSTDAPVSWMKAAG